MNTPTPVPVRVTGAHRFTGRGKNRVRYVFLPAGQYPAGKGWQLYSGNAHTNTWHKPAVLPKRKAR